MKKTIQLIIFCSSLFSYGQTNDYSKLKEKQLKDTLIARDLKIKKIEEKLKSLEKNNKSNDLQKENAELLDIISKNNEVFLIDAFKNKYVLNKDFFINTDLDSNALTKTKNSNVLLQSILRDTKCTTEDKQIAQKALDFNTNYLAFIELDKEYNSIINNKLNEKESSVFLEKINKLSFEAGSKLDTRKQNYTALIKNYNQFTCELKHDIEKISKNPNRENPLVKKAYDDLKKKEFKNYPYLLKIIDKAKNNFATFVSNDDLPCTPLQKEEAKNTNTDKKVEVKEADIKEKN